MNNEERFRVEYLGVFSLSKEYNKAYDLWLKYYYETEVYDREICSVFDKYGNGKPMTQRERVLSNKFAREKMQEVLMIKRQWEQDNHSIISKENWLEAKYALGRLSFAGLEIEYLAMKEKE